jgi:hypothetical protein
MRKELLVGLAQLYQIAAVRRAELGIWAADRQPVLLWGPRVPRVPEEETLPEIAKRQLSPSHSVKQMGTRPGLFWQEMVTRYAQTPTATRIVFLTDGGNDAPGDLPQLREAIKQLGANPNLSAAVLGVLPEHKAWLEREFRAAFGSRLEIGGPEEVLPVIRGWIDR